MGTDISMYAEVRKNKRWYKVGNVFEDPYYNKESKIDEWNYPYTDEPYSYRNYNLFAILADVRNGTGFAGCVTSHGLNSIAENRGIPEDASDEVKELLDWGYGHSYFNLKELKEYDWDQEVVHVGVISEEAYVKMKNGELPTSRCGGISGRDIVTVDAITMDKILNKTMDRNDFLKYYVQTDFPPVTYRECCEYFLEDTIPALEKLIPENGTEEDVRIVFCFDC